MAEIRRSYVITSRELGTSTMCIRWIPHMPKNKLAGLSSSGEIRHSQYNLAHMAVAVHIINPIYWLIDFPRMIRL